METLFIIALIVGLGFLIIRHVNRIQADRDALATMQTYEHISGPILVTSNFPDDPTVNARAQAWREKLRASGNKYSETLPVVAYPFALGADPKLGTLITWRQYQSNAVLKYQALLIEWDEKQRAENPGLYNGNILNQSSN